MTGETIAAAARAYVGTPWRHLGRSPTGLDCIGLLLLATRDAGRLLPDPAPYAREPQGTRLLDGILAHARRIPSAEPGDVLLFRMGLYGGHIGIASLHPAWRVPACIHAYAPHRRVVEQPIEGELAAALIGAFRLMEQSMAQVAVVTPQHRGAIKAWAPHDTALCKAPLGAKLRAGNARRGHEP